CSVAPSLCSSQGSAVHPDLHPFPTRRSSDLRRHSMRRTYGIAAVAAGHDAGRMAACGELAREPDHERRLARPADGHVADDDDRQDRKSTRLNSSHVKISYAVFCLKKKKKEET